MVVSTGTSTVFDQGDPPFGDEARCREYMAEIGTRFAPRRVALWQVLPDWADARLVGWGYADETEAVLDLPGSVHRLNRASLDDRLTHLGLCPIWMDPEPADTD
ncbi:MAG: hypothetical protein WCA46_18715 [Actinocatenispora sp.]